MAYDAKIIEVIIASPGDVAAERQIVRDVIAEWNAVYARDRGVVLLPVGWETHSSPELAGRPQQMINDRLLSHADLLVGIFWTRVGSPTGKAISGSIEEIEEHRQQGKPVMLYFSNVPVALDSVDQDQYAHLKGFKKWAMGAGLVQFFESRDDFRAKFRYHLPLALQDNPYLKNILTHGAGTDLDEVELLVSGRLTISTDAREILAAAAAAQDGAVMILRHMGGTTIQAGRQAFGESENRRSMARWEAAVRELGDRGLITDLNGQGESFQVNDAGYRLVEDAT
jgi:hypothetical protein